MPRKGVRVPTEGHSLALLYVDIRKPIQQRSNIHRI
jgi:hypothetical protein